MVDDTVIAVLQEIYDAAREAVEVPVLNLVAEFIGDIIQQGRWTPWHNAMLKSSPNLICFWLNNATRGPGLLAFLDHYGACRVCPIGEDWRATQPAKEAPATVLINFLSALAGDAKVGVCNSHSPCSHTIWDGCNEECRQRCRRHTERPNRKNHDHSSTLP